jgi:hypothetical protein
VKLKILGPSSYTRGDTAPPLDLQILNEDGTAYDIPTGATVYALVHDAAGELSFARTCSVVTASEGKVRMPIGQFTWWYPIGEYFVRCHVKLYTGEVLSTEPKSLILRGHYSQVLIDLKSNWQAIPGTPPSALSRSGYGRWPDGLKVGADDQSSDTNYGWVASAPLPEEVLGAVCSVQFWSYIFRLQAGRAAAVEVYTTKSESATEGKVSLVTLSLTTAGQVAFSSQTFTVPTDAYKIWVEMRLQAGGEVWFLEPAIVSGLPVPLS